jgi:hypothetical protein
MPKDKQEPHIVPELESPEDTISDGQLFLILHMVADNLNRAERMLAMDPMTGTSLTAAQAFSTQAQSLALYGFLLAGLGDR